MKKKIKVIYAGPLDMELDKLIQDALCGIGAEWYAQGTDFTNGERDICFDIEISPED